jgi:glycosyltransferase involved in cell wall biosynthesis
LAHARFAIVGNRDAERVLRAKHYAGPVRVIPQFGVDPELYHPRTKQDGTGEELVIGYMGRLVEEKGLQVLLRALAGFAGKWRLKVVGSGPYDTTLRALTVELGIQNHVDWLGQVASTQAPEVLRRFDILVLPSLTRDNWKEQFGRVLIEAMACEVPVIGSSSGEIPNLIGEAGVVFPEGDVVALRSSLRELANDTDLRSTLGQRGRKRVLERYTQTQIAADTYAVYKEMISRRAPEERGL